MSFCFCGIEAYNYQMLRFVGRIGVKNRVKLFDDLINEIRDLLGVEESDYETNHIRK
jgi:hypothetical protein